MRDVGNRDNEPKPLALALAVDGVVEVLRGLAVDGDERQRRDVDATFAIGSPNLGRQALGLPLGRLRKLERQVVLAECDLDFDAGIGGAAEHFLHARDRFAVFRRLLEDLDHHDLTRLRAVQLVRRNHQVLVDAAVLRFDEPDAALFVQPPDHLAVGAFEDVDDRAFGAAAAVDTDALGGDAIAVQRLVHLARAEEQIVAAGVGNEKAEAIRMTLDLAGDDVELGDDADFALAIDEHVAGAFERGKVLRKCAFGVVGDAQTARELVGSERDAGVVQRGEDRGGVGQPGAAAGAVGGGGGLTGGCAF